MKKTAVILVLAILVSCNANTSANDQKNDSIPVYDSTKVVKDSVAFDSAQVGAGIPEDHNKIPTGVK
jgi:hypothetical protein